GETAAAVWADAGNGDFTLATGSVAFDNGLTLSDLSPDIAGVSRPQGSAYDIGPFETPAGGASSPVGGVAIPIIMHHRKMMGVS
ncbi:MAG: choice-of-anchor Q domain-containing protein, partial [bacterium]